ncbi:MAG: DinB family protein [Candidatus Dormibacteraeota bacterium]|nr:DinB family protein [Candidatus Dormibacteraeota bacterium]
MAEHAPDLVAAAAYQQQLLSLLGSDDPAKVQAQTQGELRAILQEAAQDKRTRPAPKEWSILELLGHVADAELVISGRYRWALAQNGTSVGGYDQDLWVVNLRHNDKEPEELLEAFTALRTANLTLWRRASPDDRTRLVMHTERGAESYDLMFRMLAGHDRFHLNQMRQTLRQVRSGTPS